MTVIGYELDAIGELDQVDLPRLDGEADQAYRERLIVKLDWLCGVGRWLESGSIEDFGKWRAWFETFAPVEIDGLQYLVQKVNYEHGRFAAWLAPCVPLIFDHEWRGPVSGETTPRPDDSQPGPNHVRDAVHANR